MELMETRHLKHAGQQFEVRLFRTDQGFHAIGYLDNRQVTCAWSVSHETDIDMLMASKESAKEILMSGVVSDITRPGQAW